MQTYEIDPSARVLAVLVLALVLPVSAAAEGRTIERATAHLHMKTELLSQAGVQLSGIGGTEDPVEGTLHDYTASLRGDLVILLPAGSFEGFGPGALREGTGPTLRGPKSALALGGYVLQVAPDPNFLSILAEDGTPVFEIDHVHVHHDPRTGSLELRNADVRITPALAERLGAPRLAGLAVGMFELTTRLEREDAGPKTPGAVTRGAGQCMTPNFSLPIDVALTGLGSLQQSARVGTQVAITPSAMLENVGQGDVAWQEALDPDHPMLAWALYRKTGDVFEQIGVSTAKHAFFAVNENCPCPGGDVLWALGCTDVYGVFTNEDRSNLAPRDEITAHLTGWDPCGSFFDPECDAIRNFPTPADGLERRMSIEEAELLVPGAEYFIEAWYLVAGDVDIFNTMGYRRVTPTLAAGFFTFSLDTSLVNGPALDAWVAPNVLALDESAQIADSALGRFELASRISDEGGGTHRYEYALMNFDLDRGLRSLTIPLEPGTSVTQTTYSDATPATDDDWVVTITGGAILFTAPAGHDLDWGSLARLGFSADIAPSLGLATIVPGEPGSPASFALGAPVPLPEPSAPLQLAAGLLSLKRLGAWRRGRRRRNDRSGVASQLRHGAEG